MLCFIYNDLKMPTYIFYYFFFILPKQQGMQETFTQTILYFIILKLLQKYIKTSITTSHLTSLYTPWLHSIISHHWTWKSEVWVIAEITRNNLVWSCNIPTKTIHASLNHVKWWFLMIQLFLVSPFSTNVKSCHWESKIHQKQLMRNRQKMLWLIIWMLSFDILTEIGQFLIKMLILWKLFFFHDPRFEWHKEVSVPYMDSLSWMVH